MIPETFDSLEQFDDIESRLARLEAPRGRARDFSAYVGRPAEWIRDVLRVKLWQKQVEIVNAVRDHHKVCVVGAVNVGKDYTSAALAMAAAYVSRQQVLLTSASMRQVLTIGMRDVARFKSAGRLPGELLKLTLAVPGSGGILGLTSSEGSKLSGHHWPTGVFIVVSEAQAFDNEEQLAGLLSCASSEGSRIVAVGNPLTNAGWFARIAQPDSGWKTIYISAFDHPNIIEQRQVIPAAVNQRYIDDTANDFGVMSNIYISRVLGRFPDSVGGNAVFSRTDLEAAHQRWSQAA